MSSDSSAVAAHADAADESDLDPAAFLRSVRELSEKREREDAERFRKLEEDIEHSRQERARRRAERERSISPEKSIIPPSSTLISTPPRDVGVSIPRLSPKPNYSLSSMDSKSDEASMPGADGVPEFRGFAAAESVDETVSSTGSQTQRDGSSSAPAKPPSASSLARSGTLSWQQRRPASSAVGPRPQSGTTRDATSTNTSVHKEQSQMSRDQIAASLGAKDPSWFKQTSERGVGNAALRKDRPESVLGDSSVSGARHLAGMSRETSVEPARDGSPAPSESVRSDIVSRAGSVLESVTSTSKFATVRTSSSSRPDLKALIAADSAQEKASPMSSDHTPSLSDGESILSGPKLPMSTSQARLGTATERPASPTKGVGGFVQSAMMKRSDSVSKRWSAQPTMGLRRQNSTASNRSAQGGFANSHSMPKLEPPGRDSKVSSIEPVSRPSSSGSNRAATNLSHDPADVFVKPALPTHSRSRSVVSSRRNTADETTGPPPPSSPSKRWSPTKSTWLESAISKPESPKPTSVRNSQPSWMADLARVKAQRASADVTPGTSKSDVPSQVSPSKIEVEQNAQFRTTSRDLPSEPISMSSSARDGKLGSKPLAGDDGKTGAIEEVSDRKQEDKQEEKPPLAEATPPSQTVSSVSRAEPVKPSTTATPSTLNPKPDAPPKPPTDFRGNLRPRPPVEARAQETPEFLSKFGNLRKTTTQNYVAPDILKGNILRGKAELTKTDGPVKTVRRDEFKESLLSKKETWRREKEEGIVHERKTSAPLTPQKPEALLRREQMSQQESNNPPLVSDKPKPATPEALARHKSLKDKQVVSGPLPLLKKQVSAPAEPQKDSDSSALDDEPLKLKKSATFQTTEPEQSKLASRFNPGLASMLARGPPAPRSGANTPSRVDSPAVRDAPISSIPTSSDPPAAGAPLEDVRKGRAKGPKRRKGGQRDAESSNNAPAESTNPKLINIVSPMGQETEEEAPATPVTVTKPKPRAPPGSAAAIMMASLNTSSTPANSLSGTSKPNLPTKTPGQPIDTSTRSFPVATSLSNTATSKQLHQRPPVSPSTKPAVSPQLITTATATQPTVTPKQEVAEFTGFGTTSKQPSSTVVDNDKENGEPKTSSLPTQSPSVRVSQTPFKVTSHVTVPKRSDDETIRISPDTMSRTPERPSSRTALGTVSGKMNILSSPTVTSSGTPAKPAKSSRVVSGQLQDAAVKIGDSTSATQSHGDVSHELADVFGFVPSSNVPSSIDTHSMISNVPHQDRIFRTVRKTVQTVKQDGSVTQSQEREDYTFFDESVQICTHSYSIAGGPKRTEIFVWAGSSASESALDQGQNVAKRLAREASGAPINTIRQGLEPPGFLQALGGILITRRGARDVVSKQYMLCGRKHLGQIVFDEVDFDPSSLCHGYAYLISYPVTLQETRLYLWKGNACSPDELSAARLAAMDLSETGNVIEVDGGAEFSSFLRIFGPNTSKTNIQAMSTFWQRKAMSPNAFNTRLFRIEPAEVKAGIFSSIFTRRPSWNNLSPASRKQSSVDEDFKVEAKEISPFTQSDIEPDYIYMLDAYSELIILVGPVFASLHSEAIRSTLFSQTLRFAAEYASLVVGTDGRPGTPQASVLMYGVPPELKTLFRHWDESVGLWGTAGLMAGSVAASQKSGATRTLDLELVMDIVCRS